VGVPGLARGLPSSGSLLVVEAEPQRARELRQMLRDQPEALVCEEVLAAGNEATVRWHHYNDSRLNGPSDLTAWQQRFPNLRQIDEEQRCGRRLEDLLDNLVPRAGEQAPAPLHLLLRQGDPLAALTGLGPWIGQLQTVQLLLPWPEETIQMAQAWLAEQKFRQDPQISAMWYRDTIATRDWLLNKKEIEKQALFSANQKLNSDCEDKRREKEKLVAKPDHLTTQWAVPKEEHNQTHAEIQRTQIEAEKLRSQHKALQQICQQLTSEKSELLQKLQIEEIASHNSRQALKKLLPLELYKGTSIDLGDLDEDHLVLHYVQYGQHETRIKTNKELDTELKSSLSHCEELGVKLKLLETQFDLVRQQLEAMHELFATLTEKPQSHQQTREG